MRLPPPLTAVLHILQRAYPDGLPMADYYPLLAVVQTDMSEENLSQIVAEFLDDELVVIANDAAKASAASVAGPDDAIRVRSRLEACRVEFRDRR